ncbi:MAG: hypothetical protein JW828_16425 [Sedimentisphaerales bacterium]|nr:hypothetical protein [Sedimentisphaerales bacterium]
MILAGAEDVLRGRIGQVARERPLPVLMRLFVHLVVFGLLYGAVMGSFGGWAGERFLQVVYSAVKVPFLLAVTFALSVPSFFVLNTLFGLRDDFGESMRALVATQAGLTIVLASLAPFTILWYVSSNHYQWAILFNTLMFGIASISSQLLLRRLYQPLIQRNRRHRWLLRIWIIIYAFVGIQMGWTLRPFIGNPDSPVQFFRTQAIGNAYVRLAEIILACFGR